MKSGLEFKILLRSYTLAMLSLKFYWKNIYNQNNNYYTLNLIKYKFTISQIINQNLPNLDNSKDSIQVNLSSFGQNMIYLIVSHFSKPYKIFYFI